MACRAAGVMGWSGPSQARRVNPSTASLLSTVAYNRKTEVKARSRPHVVEVLKIVEALDPML